MADSKPEPNIDRGIPWCSDECAHHDGKHMLSLRGIETPCNHCDGAGVRAYSSSATWRGGAGGQTLTLGVCDRCWGSGDAHRKGLDLRWNESRIARAAEEIARLQKIVADVTALAERFGHGGRSLLIHDEWRKGQCEAYAACAESLRAALGTNGGEDV